MNRWIAIFCITFLVSVTPVFVINYLVDPLWLYSGNLISNVNFTWNERQAKVNRLNWYKGEINTLVLGTSRSTFLKEQLVDPEGAFNFSFSGAKLHEYLVYSNYLKNSGYDPSRIIIEVSRSQVSVGSFEFIDSAVNISRSNLITDQVSIDTLRFSINTLLSRSPLPRYYSPNFEVEVLEGLPVYKPNMSSQNSLRVNYNIDHSMGLLQKLKGEFPNAQFVVFIPPLDAYNQKRLYEADRVGFIEAIASLDSVFDLVIDFSLPSEVTLSPENTYDGSHYYPDVMDDVVWFLNSSNYSGREHQALEPVFFTDKAEYKRIVEERMNSVQFTQ